MKLSDLQKLGKRIAELREKAGYTQPQFGQKIGTLKIVKIEKGEIDLPFTKLLIIAEALNTGVSKMLEGL
jgi:transcriptional regulator with XRE-family HTH domain